MVACLLAVLAALALAGCSGGTDAPPPEPKPDLGTPLSQFDTRRLAVGRVSFCEAVPAAAVGRAIGGEPTKASSYAPGEKVRLTRDVKDVAHEFGCVFKGTRKQQARAWVFAPPVTVGQAKELVGRPLAQGCGPTPDGAAYGKPSLATVCSDGKAEVATYAGLFGDAWLSCSVTAKGLSRDDLVDRAGRWCVEIVKAAQVPVAGE
jgi:hypothetical protein